MISDPPSVRHNKYTPLHNVTFDRRKEEAGSFEGAGLLRTLALLRSPKTVPCRPAYANGRQKSKAPHPVLMISQYGDEVTEQRGYS